MPTVPIFPKTKFKAPVIDLLFLDIDGVLKGLNDKISPYKREAVDRLAALGKADNRMQLELVLLNWRLVQQFCKFIVVHNIKVVVTSTWREGNTPQRFTQLFRLCGAELPDGYIVGCTPIMDEVDAVSKRGHEIAAYLSHECRDYQYVILDDQRTQAFLPEQHSQLASTCPYNGLVAEDLDKALAILKGHA